MMAFENSITRLTPREVRTSTIWYCSGDSSRCRLAKAGVYSYSYARSFCSAYSIKRLLVCKFPLRHRRSPTPVFLRLSLHRGRGRVLAFDPVRRAPRAIGRVLALRHELLGVLDKRLLVCKFPLRHRRSPTPVFLRLSLHRGRGRVLAFDPVRRAP